MPLARSCRRSSSTGVGSIRWIVAPAGEPSSNGLASVPMTPESDRPPGELLPTPADRAGFNRLAFAIVRRIPAGRLMTYGQIAEMIPCPANVDPTAFRRIRARWVGYALASCPDDLPWHRVVNRRGRPSRRASGSHRPQRELLLQEGTPLDEQGRFDLKRARWRPTDDELARLAADPTALESRGNEA